MIQLKAMYGPNDEDQLNMVFPIDIDEIDMSKMRELFREFEDTAIQKIIFERGESYGKEHYEDGRARERF